jgi:hypothetical protein
VNRSDRRGSAGPAVTVPDVVSMAMDEIATVMRENLLVTAMVRSADGGPDTEALYAPRGRHDADGAEPRRDMAARPGRSDVSGLHLVAIMINGIRFGEHVRVVALEIRIDGVKYPLAVDEGSIENASLIRPYRGHAGVGLDVTKPVLAVSDR